MLTSTISDLLGTWTSSGNAILAMYHDETTVRVRNSAGDDGVISADEWLARVDALRDDGWHR